MKRLTIYAYSNDNGVVGEATVYMLQALRNITDRLVIVCNAYLTSTARNQLQAICKDVYCLNCKNMTEVAYADALFYYCGQEELRQYDEITLISDSFWGPVYPLETIYSEMENQNCDYWRMTDITPLYHFVVLRKKLFTSATFSNWLETLLAIYKKSFHNMGIQPKANNISSIDNAFSGYHEYLYIPDEEVLHELSSTDAELYLIKEKSYPFLSKELFELTFAELLQFNQKYPIRSIMQDIQNTGTFDLKMIESERILNEKNQKTYDLSPDKLRQNTGRIYLDYGEGYSEKNMILGYYFTNNQGDFEIRFSIESKKPILGFRYDPLDKIPNLIFKIDQCKCDGVDVIYKNHNGQNLGNNVQIFRTLDPYYKYDFSADSIQEIVVTGNMCFANNFLAKYIGSCAVTSYTSTLFWDEGNGYSEANKIETGLMINKNNEFSLRIPCNLNNIRGLRFDPVEGFKCKLDLSEIMINDKKVRVRNTNGRKLNRLSSKWIFDTFDPAMELMLTEKNVTSVYVRGKIQIM